MDFVVSEKCASVVKLTHAELENKMRSLELYFRYPCKGHISKGCKAKSSKCRGNHNVLFCRKEESRVFNSSKVCDRSVQMSNEGAN